MIKTDVIESSLPLLLSKASMKKANTNINFKDDKVTMFGEEVSVKVTKSGHYAVPLNQSEEIMKDINLGNPCKITLVVTENDEDKHKVAMKLHAQFGHPPKERLVKFLQRAGRAEDLELRSKMYPTHAKSAGNTQNLLQSQLWGCPTP